MTVVIGAGGPLGQTAPMAAGRPPSLDSLPPERLFHLDVRDDLRRGEEPFERIMTAVRGLGPDQVLVLRALFEPVPLYRVLGRRGFAHWAESRGREDWTIWFWRDEPPKGDANTEGVQPERAPRALHPPLVVDVRGLEPPQPMVRILTLLKELAPGERLIVIQDRRPLLLYPQLEARGFRHETEELGPGQIRISIWPETAP